MRFAEHWSPATVVATRDLCPTIREIVLRPAVPVASYAPGSHINVSVMVGDEPQTRSYSLVGAPEGGLRHREQS